MNHPQFLRVRNWEEFQHYKDRRPPWIKLHVAVTDDYSFSSLGDSAKFHVIGIWLLAARTDNKIPNDAEWIRNRIGADDPIDLDDLVERGFLVPWKRATGGKAKWPSRYISAALRQEILERDGHECRQCLSTNNLEIDHVLPVSRGGTSTKDNLQVLCRSCNRAKRVRVRAEQVATQTYHLGVETETEAETETYTSLERAGDTNGNGPVLSLFAPPGALENLGSDREQAYGRLLERVVGGDRGTPRVLMRLCKQLPADRIDLVAASFKRCVAPGVAVNALKAAVKAYESEVLAS